MTKSAKDNLKEKLAGIYRNNKFSPLFTRAAEIELDNGNLTEAVEILKNGLKIYPEYSTAIILMGKILLEQKDYRNAEEYFRKGCNLINSRESLNYYITEIEKRKRRDSFTPEEESISDASPGETFVEKDEFPVIEDFKDTSIPDEDELDELVKKIDNAKINFSENVHEPIIIQPDNFNKDSGIISETLAKIYISQGKFKEAMEVYKKLLVKQPEKKDLFELKIKEIETQISGMDW